MDTRPKRRSRKESRSNLDDPLTPSGLLAGLDGADLKSITAATEDVDSKLLNLSL